MEIKFSELLTAALETKNPQLITRIPKCFLNETEIKYSSFVEDCVKEGWTPTLETFKRQFRFIEMPTEIPGKVLYSKFTEQRRDTYIAEKTAEFVEDNQKNGKSPYQGMASFQRDLLDKTVIFNPEIIDYGALPRDVYVSNTYRSKYHAPYFDEISQGLQGGDFVVIMAGTKGFKTTLLKSLAQGAYFEGKENVVFCSQEQAALAMSQQLDMQALERNHASLRAGISEEQLAELKGFQTKISKRGNKFFITPPVRSVRQLHEYLTSLNTPIHKVFIDGLNLMQGDYSDSYGSLQKVCSELKAYAIEHNIIIIAVTQSNREGYKSSMNMGAQHIAGSFAIAMFADVMLALSTIEEDGKPQVYVRPILNRHGDLTRKILMQPDYKANGRFTVQFGLLPPDYSPEDPVISIHARNMLKASFTKETGAEWKDVEKTLGPNSANALLEFLGESNTLNELNEAVKEQAEDLF